MVMAKRKASSYEEIRLQRLEENKKRLDALNLPSLAQALCNSTPLMPSPIKSVKKPRTPEKQVVLVRRSGPVANLPAPCLQGSSKHRDLSNRVYASEEARAEAIERAEEIASGLEPEYPNFIKTILQSHVSGGFWLGLPVHFCKTNLPKHDEVMTLIDEEGEEYQTIFLARKTGLSGGWKGFSVAHKLGDGDPLIFQLIWPSAFQVLGRTLPSSATCFNALHCMLHHLNRFRNYAGMQVLSSQPPPA